MKINLKNISCSYGKLYLMFNMCTHIYNKFHTFIVFLRRKKDLQNKSNDLSENK